MFDEKSDQRIEVPYQFTVHIQGGAIQRAISLQRKPSDQQDIDGLTRLSHVVGQQGCEAVKSERRQI